MQSSRLQLRSAQMVGVDAEWFPGDTSAAILQLAMWSEVHIWDMQALDPGKAAEALHEVFAAREVRKLGFGFAASDWPRLASWLSEAHCVVDLDLLFAHLHPEEPLAGLRGLVARCLGQRLEKAEQCSNWAARPLSQQQLQYAALDAHCLLQVYNMLRPGEPDVRAVEVDLSRGQGLQELQGGLCGVEIRAAVVQSAWSIPGSRHLCCCSVSLGSAQPRQRQLVQGFSLRPGQRVLVICNLPSREMHGVQSQGGLLVASFEDGRRVAAAPPCSAALGALLQAAGPGPVAAIDLAVAGNAWARLSCRLSTGDGTVLLDGMPLMLGGDVCTVAAGPGGIFK
eukprot:TRINITY_DN65953_c0_g1_i1.p1 TRINITY_DN65953_c0_g1~~TRINITY_DN65953_c0_g1_i1.p1  ORF type:complete len:365 (+),score=82.62 TRINITY_DN65953_c0_g1_i1:79-1095(+)